jgi:hypothetical protein
MPMQDISFLMAAITVFRYVTPYSPVKFTEVSEDTASIFMWQVITWPKIFVLLSPHVFQDKCKIFQNIETQTFHRMKCN